MDIPSELLKQITFGVRVSEDGDVSASSHVKINNVSWTLVIMDPEDHDDTEDPTSGSPEFFKRLLLEGHFQMHVLNETNTIELY
jgi:hypothetical protein